MLELNRRAWPRHATLVFSIISILFLSACGPGLELKGLEDLPSMSRTLRGEAFLAATPSQIASVPTGFGVANENPLYNPHGGMDTVFVDAAKDTLALGIKTTKIQMSRAVTKNPAFYHLPAAQLNPVKSLKELAEVPAFREVLAMPFHTIFISADTIADRYADYWAFDKKIQTADDLQKNYQETYDLAVYFLTQFKNENKTFVLQNHEGDWHTLREKANGELDYEAPGTDMGLANFREYWRVRQRAVTDARAAVVNTKAKVYHLCEVVRLRGYLQDTDEGVVTERGKSLTRDILPQVTCDLVGYSAHDTANDETATPAGKYRNFHQALKLIRAKAKPSPTFGTNQVVVSEIAVPEIAANGAYLPQVPLQAELIRDLLKAGMPYVLYWSMWENAPPNTVGDYLRRPDGSLSEMMRALYAVFASTGSGGGGVDPQDPVITDPKDPGVIDPKEPVIADPKDPVITDPKDPVVTGPQTPVVVDHAPTVKALYAEILPGCLNADRLQTWTAFLKNGGSVADFRTTLVAESAKQPACMRGHFTGVGLNVWDGYKAELPGCWTTSRQKEWVANLTSGASNPTHFRQSLLNAAGDQPACARSLWTGHALTVFDLYKKHLPGCWNMERHTYWTNHLNAGTKKSDFENTLIQVRGEKPGCLKP